LQLPCVAECEFSVVAGFILRKLFCSSKPWFAHIICSCRPWSAKNRAKASFATTIFIYFVAANLGLLKRLCVLNVQVKLQKTATTWLLHSKSKNCDNTVVAAQNPSLIFWVAAGFSLRISPKKNLIFNFFCPRKL